MTLALLIATATQRAKFHGSTNGLRIALLCHCDNQL